MSVYWELTTVMPTQSVLIIMAHFNVNAKKDTQEMAYSAPMSMNAGQ